MPIVIVATMTAKPESVDTVRDACKKAVEAVHGEPGCDLYSLHEADGTFVFVEQWADADALQAHSGAPAVASLFGTIGGIIDSSAAVLGGNVVSITGADLSNARINGCLIG